MEIKSKRGVLSFVAFYDAFQNDDMEGNMLAIDG